MRTVRKRNGNQPVAMMKKGGKAKKKVKNAKLAAMYGDPNKITRGDIITAAKRKAMKKTEEKSVMRKGLYANIHAKRKRGGKMRKKGAKGAPTAANFRRAAQTARKK